MVLIIALLHALPIWWIGEVTGSRVALVLVGVLMGCVAVLTGSPRFAGVDLLAVIGATVVLFVRLSRRPRQ